MRRTSRFLLPLAAVVMLAGALPLHAQYGPETGSRVRVLAPLIGSERLYGTVADASADSLSLALAGRRAMLHLDKHTLESIEVSRGHARLKWGVLGAAAGLVGGSLLGAAVGGAGDESGFGALIGFISGAVIGTPVGAVGGALIAPERWDYYPLPSRSQ